jgi:hypothetical protein
MERLMATPATVPEAVTEQYKSIQTLQALAIRASRRAWAKVIPGSLSRSWDSALRDLVPIMSAVQLRAATAGADYGVWALAEQGEYVAPDAFVDPRGFAGVAADGRSLSGMLYSPVTDVKALIGGGMSVRQALSSGSNSLDRLVQTAVADASRQAASVDIATRPQVGYVRMLNPPSCGSCVILAGRFYRWNSGFLRHPKCDCIHSPAKGSQALKSEGLVDDPYEYFNGLSEKDQNNIFGKGKAQAIRDGGDIFRVQNSYRGKDGLFTAEGTGKRGFARDLKGQRLTPEGIYKQAKTREEAVALLERHGYVTPQGQVPGGAIVGQREGFGALGRGGTRVGARAAVEKARVSGVHSPTSRATMTDAERRLNDSRSRYEQALSGRNPYSRDGKGLTPMLSAQAETDYRRWLASGGQIFPS